MFGDLWPSTRVDAAILNLAMEVAPGGRRRLAAAPCAERELPLTVGKDATARA